MQSASSVILEPPKIKSLIVSIVAPPICHEVMGPDAMILVFWMLSFKSAFSLSSFTFIKRLFSSLLSAIRVVSSAYLRLLIFLPATLIPACTFVKYLALQLYYLVIWLLLKFLNAHSHHFYLARWEPGRQCAGWPQFALCWDHSLS